MEDRDNIAEKELLVKLRNGDHEAFRQLYRQHARLVFSRLKQLVAQQQIVEELHQDVFLKVWEGRERINPETPYQAVLMRTAKSIAIDFYRKAVRDQKLREHLLQTATELYDHLNESIDFNNTNELIEQAIAKLPPQRQKIFRLCKLEGKSYEEVAQAFGVSLSTVKDHMAKAMNFLKKELSAQDPSALFVLIATALLFE